MNVLYKAYDWLRLHYCILQTLRENYVMCRSHISFFFFFGETFIRLMIDERRFFYQTTDEDMRKELWTKVQSFQLTGWNFKTITRSWWGNWNLFFFFVFNVFSLLLWKLILCVYGMQCEGLVVFFFSSWIKMLNWQIVRTWYRAAIYNKRKHAILDSPITLFSNILHLNSNITLKPYIFI